MNKLSKIIYEASGKNFSDNIVKNIGCEMYLQHISFTQLAKRTGVKESTLRYRINHPGTFRMDEISRIAKALHRTEHQLMNCELQYSEVPA